MDTWRGIFLNDILDCLSRSLFRYTVHELGLVDIWSHGCILTPAYTYMDLYKHVCDIPRPHAGRRSRQYHAFTDCAVRLSNNIRGDTLCIHCVEILRVWLSIPIPLVYMYISRNRCEGVQEGGTVSSPWNPLSFLGRIQDHVPRVRDRSCAFFPFVQPRDLSSWALNQPQSTSEATRQIYRFQFYTINVESLLLNTQNSYTLFQINFSRIYLLLRNFSAECVFVRNKPVES